jgi:hydrogenase expression/formation protein HypE
MNDQENVDWAAGFACPIPITGYSKILLAHGGGGKLSQQLIEKLILPQFANEHLDALHDGAVVPAGNVRLAFSTDAYVVHPLFFPGGSIGDLAVNGTVNDLAMCGAIPQFLSVALILEEGLPMETLWRVILDMRRAAAQAGVQLVTGDTKVVDRGKGDGVFITTSGIGLVPDGRHVGPTRAHPGDVVILSGPIAAHGIAIMSVREGIAFSTTITSDTAPLNGLVETLYAAVQEPGRTDRESPVHVLRDPTRGGVASALNEIAAKANLGIEIDETTVPVDDEVRGACELLGFDPLYVANEGRVIVIVEEQSAGTALEAVRGHPLGSRAAPIGTVVEDHPGRVVLRSSIGGRRIVDMLSGEQLPRIC